jgi:hypothetical protein
MSKKLFIILWIITALAIIILLALTISFAMRSSAQGGIGDQALTAYLESEYPMVILLIEPDPRSIVASVEESGTEITVTELSRRGGEDWYHVIVTEDVNGWVQGEYISLDAPQ